MVDKFVVCLLLVSTLVVSTWSTNHDGTCPDKIFDRNGKKLTTCKSCVFTYVSMFTVVCTFEEITKKDNGEVCTFNSTCNIAQKRVRGNVLIWLQGFCSSISNKCVNDHWSPMPSVSTTTFVLIGVGGFVVIASIVVGVVCLKRRNNSGGFGNF